MRIIQQRTEGFKPYETRQERSQSRKRLSILGVESDSAHSTNAYKKLRGIKQNLMKE